MKTIFIILFKLFSIGDSFKLNASQQTQHSDEKAKEFIMTIAHVIPRLIVSRIINANPKHKCEP